MIPWSIGWVGLVVFVGRKMSSVALRLSTLGWAGQLSAIIATFHPCRLPDGLDYTLRLGKSGTYCGATSSISVQNE